MCLREFLILYWMVGLVNFKYLHPPSLDVPHPARRLCYRAHEVRLLSYRVSTYVQSLRQLIISRLITPLDITLNRTAPPVSGAGFKEEGKRGELYPSSIEVNGARPRVIISLSRERDIYLSSQS